MYSEENDFRNGNAFGMENSQKAFTTPIQFHSAAKLNLTIKTKAATYNAIN